LLKKSDGFEMPERKESGWGASRINRSVEGGFLNQTCVAPWAKYLFSKLLKLIADASAPTLPVAKHPR
jgi:hypothetical protein